MKIAIYQIAIERDENRLAFQSLNHIISVSNGRVPAELYDCVFAGEVSAQTLEQARTLFTKGDYEKAKPVFKKYAKSQPSNGNYNYWYGVCCLKTGEAEEAVKDGEGWLNLDELKAHYQRGGLGDVKVKKFLNNVMQSELAPIRERRKYWEEHLTDVYDILKKGSEVAEAKAAETLKDVKAAMKINYFEDSSLLKGE